MCHYTEENEVVEIDIRRIQWLFAVVRKHRVVLDLPRKIQAGGICVFLKSSPYLFFFFLDSLAGHSSSELKVTLLEVIMKCPRCSA